MKQAAKLLLDLPVSSNQQTMKAMLKSLGVSDEDADYRMGVLATMLVQAANGNVKAATFLRDTAGESPVTEMRKEELKQRKTEFEHKKKMDEQMAEVSEETESFADTIVSAFENRKKEETEGNGD